MKKGKKKDLSQIFNQKDNKLYTVLFAFIFFVILFKTSSLWLLLLSVFFICFSITNLLHLKFKTKVIISIFVTPFLFLIIFGLTIAIGLVLMPIIFSIEPDSPCKIDSDCVLASEVSCSYKACEGNCENLSIMPAFNKKAIKNREVCRYSPGWYSPYRVPDKISCINNKCEVS